MDETTLVIMATIAVISLIDFIPRIFTSRKRAIKYRVGYGRVPHYVIMPTVYGDIKYLKNIVFLKKYAGKVVICTAKYQPQKFYTDLSEACRQFGFRYMLVEVPVKKGRPVINAYSIYKGAFTELERLGADSDTPCLLMDADTYTNHNVNNIMRTFIVSGIDIASVRCEAHQPQNLIETLQDFEYRLAMDNRRMDPWLTSGAANIGKAGVLRHVFSRHSDFFAGGDIEIGKLARVMGYAVRHIDSTFYTIVPNTIKDWYSQRIIWFAGGIRHSVINIAGFGWYHFFIFFYNSLLIYLLFPLRWIEVLNYPFTMPVLILFSWLYTFILTTNTTKWRKAYLLLPFYAFVQSMFIIPVAFFRYVKYAWSQKSFGLLNYDLSRYSLTARSVFTTLNISSAVLVMAAAVLFTIARVNYWSGNGLVFGLFQ